ncbi:unnamed protein product [Amoebophrya sp. A25]|nr:unnamed protein product [Amoebophrya sp. A25]|eukprot:GSA25T00001788001.1
MVLKCLATRIKGQYARYPNLAPLAATFCLFGASDVLAQAAERQHQRNKEEQGKCGVVAQTVTTRIVQERACHGTGDEQPLSASLDQRIENGESGTKVVSSPPDRSDALLHQLLQKRGAYDVRRTLGVALCAPFFNGGPLLWFHRGLDLYIGPEPTIRRAVPKMLAVQFLYMPISTPAFIFLSKFFVLLLCGQEAELGGVDLGKDDATESRKDTLSDGRRPEASVVHGVSDDAKRSTTTRIDEAREKSSKSLLDRNCDDPASQQGRGTTTTCLQTRVQHAFNEANERMQSTFWESYVASFFFWPLSDLLNFTVIQSRFGPHFRTTWDAVIDLGWNFYLSTVTFRTDESFMKWQTYLPASFGHDT